MLKKDCSYFCYTLKVNHKIRFIQSKFFYQINFIYYIEEWFKNGPEKILYNYILVIVIYKYKNKGLLLWQDRPFNVYATIDINNICNNYMKFEIDKMFVWLDVIELITLMIFNVWPSACLVRNHRDSLRNICLKNHIWFCDRVKSSWIIDRVSSTYTYACAVLYCVDFLCAPRWSWIMFKWNNPIDDVIYNIHMKSII